MGLDHRAFRPGSRHVLAWLAAAGLALALLAAAGTAAASAGRAPAPGRTPLAGKIIGIDPGHNGLNYTDPAFLAHRSGTAGSGKGATPPEPRQRAATPRPGSTGTSRRTCARTSSSSARGW